MKILNYLKKALLLFLLVPAISFSQEKDLSIRIEQDEKSVKLTDFQTNLTLDRKGFKFQIFLDQLEGVFVFASDRDSIYRFTETSPIRDFAYLKLLELRETDKFNLNKELSLSETGWSYWFYDPTAEWHPFSRQSVSFGTNRVVCTKVIKQLYDVEAREVIKLKNIKSPLYIFFVAVKEYDEKGVPVKELMRRKVKITWSDED
ncbi:MAG: hypothetical protein WAT34_00640 [Chitinophagaceae bacterium]